LILGSSGMLGHKLLSYLSARSEFKVYGTCRGYSPVLQEVFPELTPKIFWNVDVTEISSLVEVIGKVKPDLVINCIGVIKQKTAPREPVTSIYTNALFPHLAAAICRQAGIRFIHISTDCVFNGQEGNYSENFIPNCSDLYGRSKLLGEVEYPHCLTLRTSIIGHELNSCLGLLEWFLAQKDQIQGYTRHIFSGLPTVELAEIIGLYVIPNPALQGIYQVSADPISKYNLLKLIATQYRKMIHIKPVDETSCNRSLDSGRFRHITGYRPASWPHLVQKMHLDYIKTPYPSKE